MIQEIKRIVDNYLNNAKLCRIVLGTVTAEGIWLSDKLTLPEELIAGNLKKTVSQGDQVWLLRNHGGQQYYILEVIR